MEAVKKSQSDTEKSTPRNIKVDTHWSIILLYNQIQENGSKVSKTGDR